MEVNYLGLLRLAELPLRLLEPLARLVRRGARRVLQRLDWEMAEILLQDLDASRSRIEAADSGRPAREPG